MILEVPGEPGSQLSERFLVGGGGGTGRNAFGWCPPPWVGSRTSSKTSCLRDPRTVNPGGSGGHRARGQREGHPRLVQQHQALCTASWFC